MPIFPTLLFHFLLVCFQSYEIHWTSSIWSIGICFVCGAQIQSTYLLHNWSAKRLWMCGYATVQHWIFIQRIHFIVYFHTHFAQCLFGSPMYMQLSLHSICVVNNLNFNATHLSIYVCVYFFFFSIWLYRV